MQENKRSVTKSQHDLDRELVTLDREEKRITLEIKKAAKANQMSSAKTLAKEVCHSF